MIKQVTLFRKVVGKERRTHRGLWVLLPRWLREAVNSKSSS